MIATSIELFALIPLLWGTAALVAPRLLGSSRPETAEKTEDRVDEDIRSGA